MTMKKRKVVEEEKSAQEPKAKRKCQTKVINKKVQKS